ncbi:hypothetical protein Zm00014a_043802 [Zea mays]|uniref:Uncharacterized protein n=1 Tax=Zea mays TaxID=4577 RepID=A0A3L6FR21_MAIZE|nr:hypothetical protein Zm00014a_043802 [Zea mays]
MSEGLKKE